MRCLRPLVSALLLITLASPRPLRADIADIRKSVVRVTTTSQNPDYKVPLEPREH